MILRIKSKQQDLLVLALVLLRKKYKKIAAESPPNSDLYIQAKRKVVMAMDLIKKLESSDDENLDL